MTREAYSREVISFGFWFGDDRLGAPAFYAYTAPDQASSDVSWIRTASTLVRDESAATLKILLDSEGSTSPRSRHGSGRHLAYLLKTDTVYGR